MKSLHIALALGLALVAQTALVPVVVGVGAPVDLVLIVVVFAALSRGPVVGLWTGTLGGMLQDALSGGIIGVSGLAKTAIGVLSGVAGSQFLLGTVWHRLAILMAASVVHAFCYIGVYALIDPSGPVATIEMVSMQAVANAVVGLLSWVGVRAAPNLRERFRPGRSPLGRRRWIMS